MSTRRVLLSGLIAFGLMAFAGQARSAEIAGSVTDAQNNPVAPAHVSVKDKAGNEVGSADANSQGQYSISGVPSGEYKISLALPGTKYLGQTIQSGVQPEGLCLDWSVSQTANALATGRPGASAGTCNPAAAGYTATQLLGLGLGVGVVASGISMGALGAAGYWSGGGAVGGKPSSPGF